MAVAVTVAAGPASAILRHLGTSWSHLAGLSGTSRAARMLSQQVQQSSLFVAPVGDFLGTVLEPSWSHPGPSWNRLGALSGPSRGRR